MFSPKYKPLSVLGILMVSLTILLCFPWAAIAQFGEQRLIPLAAEDPKADPLVVVDETIPSQDFVVYGRANEGYPTVAGGILIQEKARITPVSYTMSPTNRYQTH